MSRLGQCYDDIIRDYCNDDPISIVIKVDDQELIIRFTKSDYELVISAEADCCSESWFDFLNIGNESMIGKNIRRIYHDEYDDATLPPSGRQTHDDNKVVVIEFDDDTDVRFILRNSSNGFYSGYFDVNFREK
jgi:hypothetical protein